MSEEVTRDKATWLQMLSRHFAAIAGCLTAIGTILVAVTPAYEYLSGWFRPAKCASLPGYPLGRWEANISKKDSTEATYAGFLTFTSSTQGTWLPYDGRGTFSAAVSPKPATSVTITFRLDTRLGPARSGDYSSINELFVSNDGCQMEGTFHDSQGHRGYVVWSHPLKDKKPQ